MRSILGAKKTSFIRGGVMLISAPKGTKDILADQTYKWQFVEQKFREQASRYGYRELRTPTIEHTELYARGVGQATDIVEKQMYTFSDYGDRSITLRPEGTAGAARSYLEHKEFAAGKPSKYWYELSCFRYEKPQAGRLREFHQFGLEVFGSSDMLADADVISFADEYLRSLGIKELALKINSIGCPKCRPLYREALKEFLSARYDELCDTCKARFDRNPMRILDCKSPVCRSIAAGAPVMMDHLCDECNEDFESLKIDLTAAGIEFEVDPLIVRGLDYYTKTAFEFVSESIGAQGTVCGGGRYDHLIEELGGDEIPGVGFGMGIERLLLVLETSGVVLPEPRGVDALVIFLSEEAKGPAIEIVRSLRASGFSAEVDLCGRGMKAQFKYADREGVRFAVVLGDDEMQAGEVTLKDMNSGEQKRVDIESLATEISSGMSE